MDPVSIYPAVSALAVTLGITFFFANRVGVPPNSVRFVSIDGLRGYLAFFVFLHHSSIWYFYLRTGKWAAPPSHLYTHFGQSSVVLFFMITGFLFWTKLIDGKNKPINWSRLYVSRILRLAPLYIFVIFILVTLIAVLTDFSLNDSPVKVFKDIVKWSTFTILGGPDLNGFARTSIIVAGVTWSLPYEWFFYLSLPVCAVLIGVIPPSLYLFLSATCIVFLILWQPGLYQISSFGGGISAAFLVRHNKITNVLSGAVGTLIAFLCLIITILIFPSAYTPAALILLSIAFTIVACGNTLFGLLSNNISRTLGETAYSIYLMHGIVLFVTFRFIIGFEEAANMSAIEHWLVVLICSAALIPICFTTFHFIEAPAMRTVPIVTNILEKNVTFRISGGFLKNPMILLSLGRFRSK